MFGNYGINTLSVTPEPASPPVSPGTVTPYTAPSVYPSYYQDDDLSSAPFATAFVPGWQDGYVPPAPSAYVPVADSFGYNAPSSYSGHVYPSVFQSDDLTPVVPPSPTPSIDFADPIWSIRPTADDHSWSYIDPRLLQPVPVASPFSVSDDSLQTVIVAKVPGTSRSVPVSVADSSEDEVESTGNTTVVVSTFPLIYVGCDIWVYADDIGATPRRVRDHHSARSPPPQRLRCLCSGSARSRCPVHGSSRLPQVRAVHCVGQVLLAQL